MNRTALKIALSLLPVILLACTQLPRSGIESKNIERLRVDYISSHPQGEFNDHVLNGEVVKGMDFLAVLASWGLPYERRLSPESYFEYWTYYARDKEAGRVTIYELIFKDQLLVDWNIDKNIAASGGGQHLARKRIIPPDGQKEVGQTGEKPKKKQ